MQVFQRGVNESLVIGREVVITVLDIQPHCVRIGVRDPEASPSYYEETLFLDDRDDDGPSSEQDVSCFDDELECFEDDLELTGSRLGCW